MPKPPIYTTYLVCYDIANPKRLRKVATRMEQYLTRIQKSVFEGQLNRSQLKKLIKKVKRVMNMGEDSVIIYPLTKHALRRKQNLGVPPQNQGTFIIGP